MGREKVGVKTTLQRVTVLLSFAGVSCSPRLPLWNSVAEKTKMKKSGMIWVSVKWVEMFAVALWARSICVLEPAVCSRQAPNTWGSACPAVRAGSDVRLSGLAHHQARLCSLLVLCLPALLGHGQLLCLCFVLLGLPSSVDGVFVWMLALGLHQYRILLLGPLSPLRSYQGTAAMYWVSCELPQECFWSACFSCLSTYQREAMRICLFESFCKVKKFSCRCSQLLVNCCWSSVW